MAEKYILSIDQSTQGTKVLLVNHQNQIFLKFSLSHRQFINENGWISHDLDEIKNNLRQLFAQILGKVNSRQIEGVAITNQRESAAA